MKFEIRVNTVAGAQSETGSTSDESKVAEISKRLRMPTFGEVVGVALLATAVTVGVQAGVNAFSSNRQNTRIRTLAGQKLENLMNAPDVDLASIDTFSRVYASTFSSTSGGGDFRYTPTYRLG